MFRLSNSFLRAYKRKKVISEIDGYPVFLIGDNYDSEIEKKENVIRLGRMNYVKTFEAIQRFYYALNIEPNFNLGFHDRIIRSISNGCVAITNEGKRQRDIFGDNIILYKYSEIYRVLEKINATRINEVFEMNKQANEIVKNQFSWLVILNKIIKNYRKEL